MHSYAQHAQHCGHITRPCGLQDKLWTSFVQRCPKQNKSKIIKNHSGASRNSWLGFKQCSAGAGSMYSGRVHSILMHSDLNFGVVLRHQTVGYAGLCCVTTFQSNYHTWHIMATFEFVPRPSWSHPPSSPEHALTSGGLLDTRVITSQALPNFAS